MLTTDDVFLLAQQLSDASFRNTLAAQLHAIHASSNYQGWLGTLAEAQPFKLTSDADVELLQRAQLSRAGHLTVKLNRLEDKIFLTDGVWVEPQIRVFPFCDESRSLLELIHRANLVDQADWILDLATGCGHSAIALGKQSLAFDINPRAVAYAAANRALNGMSSQHCVLALNDIRAGIPPSMIHGLDGQVLIIANMPFGPAPSSHSLPLTSNGGESGSALQIATYQAVAALARLESRKFSFRAYLMGLTVGERTANRWDIVERAVEHFGTQFVRWHLLSDEHVFRIDGERQFGNPAPLAVALPGLASCRLYTPNDAERECKIAAFTELANKHAAQGNPDIAYGIVEIVGIS